MAQGQMIEQQMRVFITDNFLYGQQHQLKPEDSFLENGLIDSTGMLELISFIEQQYGVRVEDDELIPENLDSLARLVAFVQHKLDGQAASRPQA